MSRRRLLIGFIVVLLGVGAAIWWTQFRTDPVSEASLPVLTTVVLPSSSGAVATSGGAPAGSTVVAAGTTSAEGSWNVVADADTFVGYRIDEQFAAGAVNKTAVGRTPSVTGSVSVAGSKAVTAAFEADMTVLKSDDARRDSALRSRAIQSSTFPKSTFALTQPIDFGALPKIATEISTKAVGTLTLHGVAKEIALDLTARWAGDRIDIVGKAPISLVDFGIEPPTITGILTVQDHGTLEVQLHLAR